MKTRKLEMAVALSNKTWSDCNFVDVPATTPDDELERVGTEIILKRGCVEGLEIAHAWVYNNRMEDDQEGIDLEMAYCHFCQRKILIKTATLYEGRWVGECCLKRLRPS